MNTRTAEKTHKSSGLTIGAKLIMTFLGFIITLGILLVFAYQHYVPNLVLQQVNLRAISVAKSFSSAALEPVLIRNYLRVNKIAEVTSTLPDIAYAAVFNKRGFPIAGIFGDLQRFDPDFVAITETKGFPRDIAKQNMPESATEASRKEIVVGRKMILDIALKLGNSGAQVHIGLFLEDIHKAVQDTLIPLLILLAVMTLLGTIIILLVSRTVSKPIRQLTQQAHEISMGHLDQTMDVKGGGEIADLANSFTRMQSSIKYTLQQQRKKRA